ncbi:MAG: hypothetical protein LBC21_00690 [Oscillospiraceae bacterium]|nr:hypothetical protein [Oscillospiraceae bacterium]
MRFAAVSEDGENIGGHLGQAGAVLVFDIAENGDASPVGERPGLGGSGHGADALAPFIAQLSDCSFILAGSIGPRMQRALAAQNISALETAGSISDAARKLADYERRRQARRISTKNGGTP